MFFRKFQSEKMEPTDLSVKTSTKKSYCTPRSSPRDVTNIETSHSK